MGIANVNMYPRWRQIISLVQWFAVVIRIETLLDGIIYRFSHFPKIQWGTCIKLKYTCLNCESYRLQCGAVWCAEPDSRRSAWSVPWLADSSPWAPTKFCEWQQSNIHSRQAWIYAWAKLLTPGAPGFRGPRRPPFNFYSTNFCCWTYTLLSQFTDVM